jgi:hypothetical protein
MATVPCADELFGHLLHDVASRVMGIGLMLDLLAHTGAQESDSPQELEEVRRGTNTLRYLVTDLGELSRFVSRRGPARLADLAAADVASDLDKYGLPGMPPRIAVIADEGLPQIAADKPLVGFVLAVLARASWRHDGRTPTVRVSRDGTDVAFEVVTTRPSKGTGTADCWPYDKPPHAIDYFCSSIAAAHGGRFERTVSELERVACLRIPVKS